MSRKRQKRGQERIDALLRAAEEVFAEVGYERATTNLIAQRAEASPGTLYQFFRNKEEMAIELANRHMARSAVMHDRYLSENRQLPRDLVAEIDSIVDPLLSFEQSVLALEAIELAVATTPELRTKADFRHRSAVERLSRRLKTIVPHLTPAEGIRVSEACGAIFQGFLPMVRSASARQRKPIVKELKTVLHRYLEPYYKGKRS